MGECSALGSHETKMNDDYEWPVPEWGKDAPKIVVKPPGPKSAEIISRDKVHVGPCVSAHVPIVWSEARGAVIRDVDDNVFIDFTSGSVSQNAGHCHPMIVEAISDQARRLINCYDFVHDIRFKLMDKIAELTPGKFPKKVYLCTIGSEAVENSVRLARVYTNRHEIISFHGSFHGRATTVAASLTGDRKYREAWGPLPGGVVFTPFAYCYRCAFGQSYPECNFLCVEHLERVFKTATSDVAGLIVEPVQGAGGYVIPPDGFLQKVKEFCEEHDILFIADEIQTNFGRTGKLFACEHWKLEPDIIDIGKGLSSSIPISAVCAHEDILNKLKAGQQSTTYGSNPLSCAAALASIDVMTKEKLPENASRIGGKILKRLMEMKEDHKLIGDVRGLGLMIGVEMVKNKKTKEPASEESKKLAQKAFEKGVVVYPAGWWAHVFRIAPPLVINEEQAQKGIDIFEEALTEIERER